MIGYKWAVHRKEIMGIAVLVCMDPWLTLNHFKVLQYIPCSNRAWWLFPKYTWLRCIWVDIKKVRRSEAAAQGILNCLFLSSKSKCVLEQPGEVLKQDQPNSSLTTHSIQRATAEATFKWPGQHPGTREQQITSPSPQTCPSDDSQTASIGRVWFPPKGNMWNQNSIFKVSALAEIKKSFPLTCNTVLDVLVYTVDFWRYRMSSCLTFLPPLWTS